MNSKLFKRYVSKFSGIVPSLFCILFFLFLSVTASVAKEPLLLKKYSNQNVTGWLMSEKLDGIRAIWTGSQLVTRRGNVIAAPKWFLDALPPFSIDGELWTKRGDFEHIQSIVMKDSPGDDWKEISYNIFDAPDQPGGLIARLGHLRNWQKIHQISHLKIIPQIKCRGDEHLQQFQKQIENIGGEGVVVRDPKALYNHGRSATALKVKSFDDDECRVVGHNKGNGKYRNLLGSIDCKMADGKLFRIGSGFSDAERENPPPIGSLVTYKHQGWTANGLPRFPVFLRTRIIEKNQ